MGQEESETSIIKEQLANVVSDMNDIKGSMKQIADAMTKLAILEDRQASLTSLTTKTLERLETVEARQHATELRLATGAIAIDQLTMLRSSQDDLKTRVQTIEVTGKNASTGLKAAWAIFGAAITSGLAYIFVGGKG